MSLHSAHLLCQFKGVVELVGLREEKSDDPQNEDPLQDQVVRRSLRNEETGTLGGAVDKDCC